MQEVFTLIERVATSNVSVLITGESGTGKELVARTLHDLSPRRSKPFVAVNCAAIPETLIESEIFGHEKGAFTGAIERRAGCFELAEDGTLLLDEIGEMPVATQAKLLRVLEDRKLRRLGSKVESPIDVRVLAATNKNPEEAVADGHLRGDLYYRLNVFNIHMPPLREHKEDIPAIADAMIADMNQKHQRARLRHRQRDAGAPGSPRLAGQRARAAQHHRARHRALQRRPAPVTPPAAWLRKPSRSVAVSELPPNAIQLEVGATVDDAERMLIFKTLESTHNNKTRAAEILGISLKTLHNKLREYGSAAACCGRAGRIMWRRGAMPGMLPLPIPER